MMHDPCCHSEKQKIDYFLWVSIASVIIFYIQGWLLNQAIVLPQWYQILITSVHDLMNTMFWSMVVGVLMVAVLAKIPRVYVMSMLGSKRGIKSIFRATAAGVLLDLCSHGILMVGAKLYERGASIGQVMAFLIASPWNSLSLTLVLIALIGLPWTLAFIGLSMIIAIITGLVFDHLVERGTLPVNPQQFDLPEHFNFWASAKKGLASHHYNLAFFKSMVIDGVKESRTVLRWLFFGILLASVVRAFITPETFGTYFGPTMAGLGLTVVVATLLEVCSEGATPIAADLLTRAQAPGNSFAFLMTGVSTDYTEIMVLKETTRSWKIALMLPLITVPQVLLMAWCINILA